MDPAADLHPIAMSLIISAQARCCVRLAARSGRPGVADKFEALVVVDAERLGTTYRAELSMGLGEAAAIAASYKALGLRAGVVVVVHADRQRIVLGKRPHIRFEGVTHLEASKSAQRWRDYHDPESRE